MNEIQSEDDSHLAREAREIQPAGDKPPVVTTVRIPAKLIKAVNSMAKRRNKSRSRLIIELLERETELFRATRSRRGGETPDKTDKSDIFG